MTFAELNLDQKIDMIEQDLLGKAKELKKVNPSGFRSIIIQSEFIDSPQVKGRFLVNKRPSWKSLELIADGFTRMGDTSDEFIAGEAIKFVLIPLMSRNIRKYWREGTRCDLCWRYTSTKYCSIHEPGSGAYKKARLPARYAAAEEYALEILHNRNIPRIVPDDGIALVTFLNAYYPNVYSYVQIKPGNESTFTLAELFKRLGDSCSSYANTKLQQEISVGKKRSREEVRSMLRWAEAWLKADKLNFRGGARINSGGARKGAGRQPKTRLVT